LRWLGVAEALQPQVGEPDAIAVHAGASGRRLARLPGLRYVTGDLDSPLADIELDVMDLPFEADSFDFLICNHVLEHVADDRRAMAEVQRVLRPGGWAILMCPVDGRRARTLEDPSARTP